VSGGWGSGAWGSSPWGGAVVGLAAVSVVAVAENVLQVTFSSPVYLSGLGDPPDASQAALWSVQPVAGTVGYDGQPARAVSVVQVAVAALPGLYGTMLNLTLDRSMSPYPAQYAVANAGNLYSADLSQLLAPGALGTAYGVLLELKPADVTAAAPARDMANPNTLSAAQASNISNPLVTPLGSFGYADTGDYANESGDTAYQMRIFRRLFTRKNGFKFLPGYGVGIPSYAKKLARPSRRAQMAADAEQQIKQEPETAQCTVTARLDPNRPALTRVGIYVVKKSGETKRYSVLVPNA
jgi:hypothetical protein